MKKRFIIKDKFEREIHLSEERWKHIIHEHPEMSDKVYEIEEIIKNPLIIITDEEDERVRYYYKYYKNIKQKAKYLLVSVKYLNGGGYVITSFYTDKIKR